MKSAMESTTNNITTKSKTSKKETLGKVLTLFLGIICFLGITAAARQEFPVFKAMIEAGGSIVWEGATRNAYQTTFTVVDPTADRTITFPNSSGTPLLSVAAQGAANSVTVVSNGIEFEGSTDNGFETTLDVANPTADVTYRLPVAAAGTYSVMSSTLATNAPDVANSVTGGTNSLIFEGSGVDAFEHTIIGTNPTVGDQVWTMPDFAVAVTGSFMFSTLATNGPDIANSVTGASNALKWEGTADDFECTLDSADQTADVTYRMPVAAAGTYYLMVSSLATNAVDAANSVTGASNSIVYEGTTVDDFELSVAATDPTADRAITWPDAGGVPILASAVPEGANAVWGTGNGFYFEGTTADGNETVISVTDPTADNTITIPNQSGTVVTTPYVGDLTLSSPTNNGANGAKNEFQGLMKFKLVALGTMTNGAAAGKTIALMDDTPDGEWAASDADVVVSSDNTLEKVGTNCLKIAFSVDSDTGDGAHDAGLAYDFTDDESVSFWIYSDGAFSSGDLVLDITDNGGNHTVDLPAIVANTWTYCDLTTGITAIANADKDSISDLSIELSVAGQAVVAGRATNVYVDGGWKWDSTEEEALGLDLVTDGIVGAFVLPAAAGATADLVENTGFFVHYETGNDFLVTITDQSANVGVVAAMYQ